MKTILFARAIITIRTETLINQKSTYKFFGGKIKRNESAKTAIIRELKEELDHGFLFGPLVHVEEKVVAKRKHTRREITFFYEVTLLKKTKIKAKETHLKPFWLDTTSDEFAKINPPEVRTFIEKQRWRVVPIDNFEPVHWPSIERPIPPFTQSSR